MPMKAERVPLILGAVGVLALILGLSLTLFRPDAGADSKAMPTIGGPFTLTDHNGRAVTEADYRGKFLLMFFGYTYCPDVCPTGLQVVAQVMDGLGAAADKVQPLFISVDPGRDTPAHLKEYVGLFHARLVGLTGTPEQVAAMAKSYRAFYRVAPGGDKDNYFVDHSAYTYLMGPDGKFITVFPAGTDAQRMGEEIRSKL